MSRYVYAYDVERRDGEVFLMFPKFTEIISAVPEVEFDTWTEAAVDTHANDAVLTALQAIVTLGEPIPEPDDPRLVRSSGFVRLKPIQAMKLQLYRVYRANGCRSIADFARYVEKPDTAARRLLNLRHRSMPDEIEDALGMFGKVLEHDWDVGVAPGLTRTTAGRTREAVQG